MQGLERIVGSDAVLCGIGGELGGGRSFLVVETTMQVGCANEIAVGFLWYYVEITLLTKERLLCLQQY